VSTKPNSTSERTHLVVTDRLSISLAEFSFEFMRSSGPGGQNVNKLNTKVRLRWPVSSSKSLEEDVRGRIEERYRRRINADGEFLVTSQRFRDQERNRADCLDKLSELLAAVAEPPRKRRLSRVPRGANRKRVELKRRQTRRKHLRRRPEIDD